MTRLIARPGRRRRPRARGTLAVIGGLLIASALIRIAAGTGEAFARESGHGTDLVADDMGGTLRGASDGAGISGGDITPLLAALEAREARISKREGEIGVRMQALALAEQEIDRKMAGLAAAEESLRATLALARTAAEDDIGRLTDVYAKMKPKQAAALFEEMAPEFAAGFLARMRPDAAAAVMAGLSPRAAYTISVVLAGRNADVPKN